MNKKDCYYLGTITKKLGYQGDLNLFLDTDEPENYINLESILIEKEGLLVPFFLSKAELHRNTHLKIHLKDVDDPEYFVNRDVFLPLSTLPPLSGERFYFHEIIGLPAIDENKNYIGKITDVIDSQTQALCVIKNNDGKEILIPLIDEFIITFNREDEYIQFQVPEGLLDIFL